MANRIHEVFIGTLTTIGIMTTFLAAFIMIAYAIGSLSTKRARRVICGITGALIIITLFFLMLWS